MKNEVVKWVAVGLMCSVIAVGLLGGVAFFAFRYSVDVFIDTVAEDDEASASNALEEWQEVKNGADAIARETSNLGLDKIYQVVYYVDNSRHELYQHKNFNVVRERLNKERLAASTPLERYRYGQHIDSLARFYPTEDPAQLLGLLDEWVAHDPESHLPWLIRGAFKQKYAWHFRGSGWTHEVSKEGMRKYERFSLEARDDLTRASELNPEDPESFAHLVQAAGDTGQGLDVLQNHFDQTLALNPHHVNVRTTMMSFARPMWYGSWTMMDELVEEAEAASKDFPMLMWVSRTAVGAMMDRSDAHAALWDAPETARKWADAWNAQLAQSPEDAHLLADAAYFSAYAGDYATAFRHFRKLGNRYPDGSMFSGMPEFNRWQIYCYLTTIDEKAGTDQEGELLEEVLALALANPGVSIRYLGFLVRLRDDARTVAYYAACQDAYVTTGNWGNPPDYEMIDGMAKAGRAYLLGQTEPDRARMLRDEAIILASDNALVHLVHAEHYISSKSYEESRVHLEKARELDPDYLPALYIMGWLNYHQKRWDDGIASAQHFLTSGPSAYVTQYGDDAREIIALCEKKKNQ